MDITTLRDTDFTAMYGTADGYAKLAGLFSTHTTSWKNGVDGRVATSGWSGSTAAAARTSLQGTIGKLTAAQTELRLISDVIRYGADALMLAQSKLGKALDDLRTAGMTINECGDISWPATTYSDHHDPDYSPKSTATAISARITAALTDAGAADQTVSERLRHYTQRARDGSGLDPVAAVGDQVDPQLSAISVVTAALPRQDAPPTEVNAWWQGLTSDEQQRLIKDHPDLVGNRDGIPAVDRDQANRFALPKLIDKYEQKTQPLSEEDQRKLDGFRSIRERLKAAAEQPGDQPPVYLLGIGEEGQGRGILSFGNPDTAQNVTSFVGGLNTELKRVGGGDADRAKAVYDAAQHADPSRSTASIVWLGYDPPLKSGSGLPVPAIVADDRAQAGANAYNKFLAGQRATHQGAPAHVTAQGHSYGSLLVGLAAQRPGGLPADDVILVGSPGTSAKHASDFSVGADHVFVGAAENDYVSHAPSGLGAVGPVLDPNGAWFGTDPATTDFGGTRFRVPPGPLDGSAHSGYWDDGQQDDKTSVHNIGAIVSGRSDLVQKVDGR
ncbi:alpha/beta hydrolase [Kitasatospora purpeofusca]|uniref:alpha/beta hydrolase n=1 Tax=Kitasatospora purpeofusca TaxID=67352 RepID=UPI0035E29A19